MTRTPSRKRKCRCVRASEPHVGPDTRTLQRLPQRFRTRRGDAQRPSEPGPESFRPLVHTGPQRLVFSYSGRFRGSPPRRQDALVSGTLSTGKARPARSARGNADGFPGCRTPSRPPLRTISRPDTIPDAPARNRAAPAVTRLPAPRSSGPGRKILHPKGKPPPRRPFSVRRCSEVARTISLSRTKQPLFVPRRSPSSSLPSGQKRRRTTDDRTGKIAPGHRPARDGAHPAVMARRNTKRPSATRQRSRQRTASPHGKRCPRPVARQKKPDAPNEKGARSDSGHLRTGFHAAISAVFPYTCRSVS